MLDEASEQRAWDRKQVQIGLAVLIGTLVLGSAGFLFMASFAWPSRDAGGGWLLAARVTDLEVATPIPFAERDFFLVKLRDGNVLALYSVSPLGCEITWEEDFKWNDGKAGWYLNRCRWSIFDVDGNRVFGAAWRDLDRLPVQIEDGRIYVFTHPSRLIKGER